MGSQRVRQDWVTKLSIYIYIYISYNCWSPNFKCILATLHLCSSPPDYYIWFLYFPSNCFVYPSTSCCGYRWFYCFCLLTSLLALCVDVFLFLLYACLYQWAFPFWNVLVYSCDLFFPFFCFFLYGLHWVFVTAWGLSLVVTSEVRLSFTDGLLTGGASRCRAQALGAGAPVVAAHGLSSCSSCTLAWVVTAHGLTCSMACGILPDQRSSPCPLHWQAWDPWPKQQKVKELH